MLLNILNLSNPKNSQQLCVLLEDFESLRDNKEVREFLKKDSIAADYTFPYHFEDDENGKKIMHESDSSDSFGTYIFLYNQGENLANYSNTFIIGETRIKIKIRKDSCTLKSRHILNKKKKKQAPFELKDDTIYFIGRCPKINDDSNSTTAPLICFVCHVLPL